MATVAESLFGVTPESLQRQRQQQLRQEAMDFASISDPFQQANFAIYQGAGNLSRGVGGLLGAQDPELMRVRQRQELLQGVDIADPVALRQAATVALQNGDNAAAQELARRALDIEKTQAGIAKDVAAAGASTAAAQAGRLTTEQRNAAGLADTKATRGTPEWTTAYNAELTRLTTAAESKTSYGPEADRLSKALYGKDFRDLTKEQAAAVDKQLETRGLTKARAGAGNTELKMPPDVVGAVNAADKATEGELNMLNSARLAKNLINETARTNNSQSWEAARTTIAKAVGENKLSNEDIRRTGVDPRLVQGALDWVDKKITGAPGKDIQQQLFVLGSILENNASTRYDAKMNRFRSAAQASKFPGDVTTYFPTAAQRLQGSQPNVVDWSNLR
jgi:hypothetical protein